MENEPENQQSESRPAGVGVGERLQAARIQQGMSVDDIAGRMHLNVAIVKSIEDNNFDDITAPIFVKGYIRAYARIVSLDESELIQQYSSYYSHEDPPIATTSNMAPELSVADVRIKWTTYLVILGLAALLAAWWWNKNQNETTPISLDSQGSGDPVVTLETDGGGKPPEDESAGSNEAVVEPISAADSASSGEPTSSEPGNAPAPEPVIAEPSAAQPVPASPPEPEPITPQAAVPQAEIADEATAADTPVQPMAATPAAEAVESEAADEPAPAAEPAAESESDRVRLGAPVLVAPSGTDKLSITVTDDTWADIEDGNDFQMVYHLLRAGQSLELTGSAPFSVFLGNGHGVEIRFNGEELDFSRRIRNDNTARLRVGG